MTTGPAVRIWFNRTYATTRHLIEAIRANADHRPVHVIASHSDPDSPVLSAADEHFDEPRLSGADYAEWALSFAVEHRIDVLVPRAHMAELADLHARFEAAGVALACPSPQTVRLFDDKPAAYAAAIELGLPVPPHAVVRTGDELRAAYYEFAGLGEVCMKPVTGVGGNGYRRLTDQPPTWSEFTGEVRSLVRLHTACAALDQAAAPTPLLVSPFLNGDEVSVDVLANPDGQPLAMIGRLHTSGRRRHLVEDPAAFDIARTLVIAHQIGHLSNTQVRYWQGPGDTSPRPYLLEVNTRAAGGLFQTGLSGVNLAWLGIRVAIGEPVDPAVPEFGAAYTSISSAVRLG